MHTHMHTHSHMHPQRCCISQRPPGRAVSAEVRVPCLAGSEGRRRASSRRRRSRAEGAGLGKVMNRQEQRKVLCTNGFLGGGQRHEQPWTGICHGAWTQNIFTAESLALRSSSWIARCVHVGLQACEHTHSSVEFVHVCTCVWVCTYVHVGAGSVHVRGAYALCHQLTRCLILGSI